MQINQFRPTCSAHENCNIHFFCIFFFSFIYKMITRAADAWRGLCRRLGCPRTHPYVAFAETLCDRGNSSPKWKMCEHDFALIRNALINWGLPHIFLQRLLVLLVFFFFFFVVVIVSILCNLFACTSSTNIFRLYSLSTREN